MRIVLVNPPSRSPRDDHWSAFPVLGLAYIAAALRAKGHEVVLLDGKLGRLDAEQIAGRCADLGPHLVGFSAMTVDIPQTMALARLVKSGRDVPMVIGGAHANAVGADLLRECEAFDFVCLGEGEDLACELAEALQNRSSVHAIAGLAYRDGPRVCATSPRPYRDSYDQLPFPAWDLFATTPQIPILTQRGCPFRCIFCSHNSGSLPRYRSVANVLEEIRSVVSTFRPEVIRFEDETFGLDTGRTAAILEGIIAGGLHHRVAFSAQTRADQMDEAFASLLRRANFRILEIGVESGSDDVLARLRKGITLDQVRRAVQAARHHGIQVWCKFILGNPEETMGELLETARFISALNPDRLSVAIMTPYPGTPIHEMAVRGEHGYRLVEAGWSAFDKYSEGPLELETVSRGTLKAIQLWCYVRLYVSNGRSLELLRLALEERALVLPMIAEAGLALAKQAGRRHRQQQP